MTNMKCAVVLYLAAVIAHQVCLGRPTDEDESGEMDFGPAYVPPTKAAPGSADVKMVKGAALLGADGKSTVFTTYGSADPDLAAAGGMPPSKPEFPGGGMPTSDPASAAAGGMPPFGGLPPAGGMLPADGMPPAGGRTPPPLMPGAGVPFGMAPIGFQAVAATMGPIPSDVNPGEVVTDILRMNLQDVEDIHLMPDSKRILNELNRLKRESVPGLKKLTEAMIKLEERARIELDRQQKLTTDKIRKLPFEKQSPARRESLKALNAARSAIYNYMRMVEERITQLTMDVNNYELYRKIEDMLNEISTKQNDAMFELSEMTTNAQNEINAFITRAVNIFNSVV